MRGVLLARLGGSVQLGYGIEVILGVSFLAVIVSLIELTTRD